MHPPARVLREKINSGRPVIGAMLVEFAGPAVVSVTANAGFDFVLVDGEHGNYNPRELEATFEAGWHAGLCTILRSPDVNRAMITRSLDAGAGGVLVPFCATMDDVHQAVRASKYTPTGKRGTHLFRGHTRHKKTDNPAAFLAEANRDLLTLIQIELASAVPLVEQIAATEGVDGLYIGPGDLSVDLGMPGKWEAPALLDAIRATSAACRKHGKVMGCHIDEMDHVAMLRQLGVQMFGFYCDIGMYYRAAASAVGAFNEAAR